MSKSSVALICTLACVVAIASALHGVDLSQGGAQSTFHCLKNGGYGSMAIPRVATSAGHIDINGAETVKHAHAAGITHVDGYIFPCPRCGDGAGQVKRVLDHLHSSGAKIGRLWLDIEGSQYWTTQEKNREFFNAMVHAGHAAGVPLGVYTSASQWGPIMGNDFHGGSNLPLWYAHYDGVSSFSDFRAFAGWTKPHMKQFRGDVSLCGIGVDLNYMP